MKIERQLVFVVTKVFLIVVGLLFVIVPGLDPNVTHLRVWQGFGVLCVSVAVLWICTDKRVLTPREELEDFLIEASKRHARAGSIARLIEEYKARGADEITLARLRNAPRLLRERADDKLSLGLIFSGIGSLLLFTSMLLMVWTRQAEMALLKYVFLGALLGVAHIAQGLRFNWYARQLARLQTQPPMSSDSQPKFPAASDHEMDKAA